LGQIGTETTINSGDMAGILMIAVQALEKRTAKLKQRKRGLLYWNLGWRRWKLRTDASMQITAGGYAVSK
jgi:hypothetical protein